MTIQHLTFTFAYMDRKEAKALMPAGPAGMAIFASRPKLRPRPTRRANISTPYVLQAICASHASRVPRTWWFVFVLLGTGCVKAGAASGGRPVARNPGAGHHASIGPLARRICTGTDEMQARFRGVASHSPHSSASACVFPLCSSMHKCHGHFDGRSRHSDRRKWSWEPASYQLHQAALSLGDTE